MKKPAAIKPRNHVAAALWQCGKFRLRTGPDNKRKSQARRPTKHQLRAAVQA